MENGKIYDTPKNEADFNVYYPKNFSMNAYTERMLQKIRQVKNQSFDSQTIRNLIYEEYHRLKEKGLF